MGERVSGDPLKTRQVEPSLAEEYRIGAIESGHRDFLTGLSLRYRLDMGRLRRFCSALPRLRGCNKPLPPCRVRQPRVQGLSHSAKHGQPSYGWDNHGSAWPIEDNELQKNVSRRPDGRA